MGKLIEMPLRKAKSVQTRNAVSPRVAKTAKPVQTDFSVWKNAPRERTASYFPVYSAVSKVMQTAMRSWVREWFASNMEILQKPHASYALLVYQCTHPFSGRPTNTFTYEIQQTDTINRAFRSAANKLGRHLRALDTKRLPWFTREHYFAYRSPEVVHYVSKNPRALYRMLHVETMLMDAILRFSIIDLPKIGMEDSLVRLRRTFRVQLRRFSEHFDLSVHAEKLFHLATEALVARMTAEAEAMDTPEAA
jgi:hypothetical protein